MGNLRGILFMVAAMAGFSLADSFIKLVSDRVPTGEILLFLGLGGTLIFGALSLQGGHGLIGRDFVSPLILVKNAGEIIGTFGFVTALALTPLSSASSILQATPLAVTLGAALFLRESVGWRRWSAIAVGFIGVLMIVRPGLAGFQPASLFAVLAVIGLSMRDLATRAAPLGIASIRLGLYGFLALVPTGLVMLALDGPAVALDAPAFLSLSAAAVLDVAGYHALTLAMRAGDVSVVTPFRYVRILFAMLIGIVLFSERPDALTLIGAGVIIGSGLYTLAREHRLARHQGAVRSPSI